MNRQSSAINILAVSPFEADLVILSNLIGHSAWKLELATTLDSALPILQSGRIQVVLCDAELSGPDWHQLLEAAATLPRSPAVIIMARASDKSHYPELLNGDAWDILLKPFSARDVYRTIHMAWRHWVDSLRLLRREPKSAEAGRVLTAMVG